ncbi:FGGY-family carbohydrate kinase [Labrys monachus]|uniref:Xylulokinase n=1 Tax=Labrys monachus TaxID=217067 RepID=A0ABU0FM54_9HYPH|nr:FGGY family carbohydrate kinase [Labrys monachus]MDQ0395551.1 xylulokinase [Labrys monachus]
MAHCVIGVDIGTTGTKTGLYDEAGRLLGSAFEESVLIYPQAGWVEQRPDDIEGSVLRTISAAVAKSGVRGSDVAAIAIDGQMAGVCTVDDDWNAPTHYDSWLDNRCAAFLPRLKQQETEILRSSGCAPSYNHGPKILYWQQEHPEAWSRIRAFVQPAAYVAGRMAGLRGRDAFMDRTYLNFSTFADTANNRWNDDLLAEFGLTAEKLPRIVEPWDIVGRLTRAAAEATGLVEGTPIAAGCGDQAANVLGGGFVDPGMVYDAAGTASVFSIVIDRFATDTAYRALMTCPHVVPGLYYAMAYVAGGGLNLRWFRDAMCGAEKEGWLSAGRDPYDELAALAETAPPGSDRLVFLPHLGGRNTPNNTDMRGAFVGLTWKHGKAHMVRAIMESIGYEYALYLRSVRTLAPDLEPTRVFGIGGGARSQAFRQIKADILGLDYGRLDRDEFGTLGSAIVAGKAVGLFDDIAATARRFVKTDGALTHPSPGNAALYGEYAAFYARLLDQSAGFFEELARIERA